MTSIYKYSEKKKVYHFVRSFVRLFVGGAILLSHSRMFVSSIFDSAFFSIRALHLLFLLSFDNSPRPYCVFVCDKSADINQPAVYKHARITQSWPWIICTYVLQTIAAAAAVNVCCLISVCPYCMESTSIYDCTCPMHLIYAESKIDFDL